MLTENMELKEGIWADGTCTPMTAEEIASNKEMSKTPLDLKNTPYFFDNNGKAANWTQAETYIKSTDSLEESHIEDY